VAAVKRAGRLWRPLAAVLVVLGCAVAIMPLAPSFPASVLDSAWTFAVNAAVAQRLVFGQDLVFTFGPYAGVYTLNYHPATDALVMVASLILTAAMAAGLVVLAAGARRWLAVLLAVALSLLWLRDALFFMAPLILLALTARTAASREPLRRPMLAAGVLLVVAMALLPLVKGTFAAGALVALGLGGVLLLVRGRWRLAVGGAALFLAAMALFWLAAHQPLADLPGFFTAQSRIVAGYTEAMAIPGPLWQVAAYWGIALAVLALNAPAAGRAGLPGWAVLAGAAVLLLLAFKAGFVRQDEHVAIAAGALGMIAGVLGVANQGKAPVLGLLAGLAGWAVLDYAAESLGPRAALARMETAYGQAAKGLLERLHGNAALHRRFDAALAQIRADHPLPPMTGTADIYSVGQSVLLAHGLAWAPRPVLQSYSAYSPALAQDDARHLEGPAAPANLLVALEPIDNRLPALEDGPSWLPMLGRYEGAAMLGDTALLRRLPGPAPALLGPRPPPAAYHLGEAVPLPAADDAPLWAEIDIQPTLLGRLLGAAFKPSPLRMAVHLVDGKTYDYRYVSGMGQAGFLIAPLVADASELMALQLPGLRVFADHRVASFVIEGDPRFWRREYSLTLMPVHVPARPAVRHVLFPIPQPAAPVGNGEPAGQCWLDLVNGAVVDHTKPTRLSGLVRLTGWGFGGGEQSVEPDSIAISFRSADSKVVAAPALLQTRLDVGAYFHQPQLKHIGFQALLDLHDLQGHYRLGLEMTKGARHWSCSLIDPVDITPEP
jgi:hypothetical protein